MNIKKEDITSILATDCGSTTTKAILIEKRGDEFRLIVRGEAPTTVEAPVEDVTRGVINAVTEVSELVERPIIENDELIKPRKGDKGVDIYISTSSAGGGSCKNHDCRKRCPCGSGRRRNCYGYPCHKRQASSP